MKNKDKKEFQNIRKFVEKNHLDFFPGKYVTKNGCPSYFFVKSDDENSFDDKDDLKVYFIDYGNENTNSIFIAVYGYYYGCFEISAYKNTSIFTKFGRELEQKIRHSRNEMNILSTIRNMCNNE